KAKEFTPQEFKGHSEAFIKSVSELKTTAKRELAAVGLMKVGIEHPDERSYSSSESESSEDYVKQAHEAVENLAIAARKLNEHMKKQPISCDKISSFMEDLSLRVKILVDFVGDN